MTNKLTKAPRVIYLQVEGEFDERTWCEDEINESDIKYVRADELARARKEERELMKKERNEINKLLSIIRKDLQDIKGIQKFILRIRALIK